MRKILLLLFVIVSVTFATTIKEEKVQNKINNLEKPLYNPFVENYILHEIKQLREENRNLKVELHETLAKKEITMSNNVVNYATSTINNMFYIIAAATSLLVIVGWTSIKDTNEKVKNMIDEKTSKIIEEYEERLLNFERDLESRSKQVKRNQHEIEVTNTIHSLWLRASQESTPAGKVEIYDEILNIRPDEVEALTYKADAVLDMGEANWALNLTNQALEIDNSYANAYYQRSKIYAVLGQEENAILDLEKSIDLNEQYVEEIENDEEFETLISNEKVQDILKLKATV
ncbi:MAG: tetratricopeptide repeat protein [Halarcobacter sp.]